MVAGHEGGGEGPGLQEVQPRIVPAVAVPHAAEVPGDQDDVLFCQPLLLIKALRPKTAEVSVGKQLIEQKDQLQRRYSEAKRQMQEYGTIKQNVDGILRTTPGKEQMQER